MWYFMMLNWSSMQAYGKNFADREHGSKNRNGAEEIQAR